MYVIATTDCKGDGATYHRHTYAKTAALVKRLLEFGRRTYGDKITKIVIESGTKKSFTDRPF